MIADVPGLPQRFRRDMTQAAPSPGSAIKGAPTDAGVPSVARHPDGVPPWDGYSGAVRVSTVLEVFLIQLTGHSFRLAADSRRRNPRIADTGEGPRPFAPDGRTGGMSVRCVVSGAGQGEEP